MSISRLGMAVHNRWRRWRDILLYHRWIPVAPRCSRLADSKGVRTQRLDESLSGLIPSGYFPTNPAAVHFDSKIYATVRFVNYSYNDLCSKSALSPGHAQSASENYLVQLTEGDHADVLRSQRLLVDGIEDIRLVACEETLQATCSLKHRDGTVSMANLGILSSPEWTQDSELMELPSPLAARIEKNWMPVTDSASTLFVYSVSPFRIYNVAACTLSGRTLSSKFLRLLNGYSGSSPLVPFNEGYLAVVHKRYYAGLRMRYVYMHRLITFDRDLMPTSVGKEFCFIEPTIEFCAGLSIHGNEVLFSFGFRDRSAYLMRVDRVDIQELL